MITTKNPEIFNDLLFFLSTMQKLLYNNVNSNTICKDVQLTQTKNISKTFKIVQQIFN